VRVRENGQRLYEVEVAFGGRSKLALVQSMAGGGFGSEGGRGGEGQSEDEDEDEEGGLVMDGGGSAAVRERATVNNPIAFGNSKAVNDGQSKGALSKMSSWKTSKIVSGNNNSNNSSGTFNNSSGIFFADEGTASGVGKSGASLSSAGKSNEIGQKKGGQAKQQPYRAAPPRTFIRAGSLKRVCKRRIKTFHYVLCSDLLLYGHSTSPTQYKLHRIIGLAYKCDLRDVTATTLTAVQDERKVVDGRVTDNELCFQVQ
jgi:hypothetical protein